jgi:UDP-N-acetylglucosamine:LPS N-acetylglucosamine transferase
MWQMNKVEIIPIVISANGLVHQNQFGFNKKLNIPKFEKTVPQIKALSVLELFVTHGGNNSFTEICYLEKPMIAMPLIFINTITHKEVKRKAVVLDSIEGIEKILNDKTLI